MKTLPRSRRVGILALALLVAIVAGILLFRADLGGIPERLGLAPKPAVAFTYVAGRLSRIDPTTGAILAQAPNDSIPDLSAIAVSHDGRSLFVLVSNPRKDESKDELWVLSADTLAFERSAPVQHFMRPMESWPPALAVTPDDRTVIVSQYGQSESDPYWISYYDRQSGRFATDSTVLYSCGVSQLLPFEDQVAVLCFELGDLRFVDVRTHRVTAQVSLWSTPFAGIGSPIAAGFIPGQAALAVVFERGQVLRVDLRTHAITPLPELIPAGSGLRVVAADFSASGVAAVQFGPADASKAVPGALPIVVFDTRDGRIVDRLTPRMRSLGLTIAPDGQRLYLLGDQNQLQAIDLPTHSIRPFGHDPVHTWVHLIFTDAGSSEGCDE